MSACSITYTYIIRLHTQYACHTQTKITVVNAYAARHVHARAMHTRCLRHLGPRSRPSLRASPSLCFLYAIRTDESADAIESFDHGRYHY